MSKMHAIVGATLFAFAAGLAAQVAVSDAKGVWRGSMETQMGAVDTTITIDSVSPLAGTVQLADYTARMEKGVLDGQKIAFAITIEPGTITYEGAVRGDEMSLNVTGTTGNKMTLLARRQK